MYSIAKIEKLIKLSEDTLAKYEQELRENPNSLFCKGMVKNTKENLEELRGNLFFEKNIREKEVIDLRLKGKIAKAGRLPLDVLGEFAKSLAEVLSEIGRKNQFGDKYRNTDNKIVKRTIDLNFEKLVPGSTHIIVTGNTNPDLFGNSILENALNNTFELLNAEEQANLLDVSSKIGSAGIKKVNQFLKLSIDNELEFDLNWQAPNMERHSWQGNKDKLLLISNSISTIRDMAPTEVTIEGKIITLSLKGIIEVQDEEKRMYKIHYPLGQLEKIRQYQIGDNCSLNCIQKSHVNSITREEKITYEFKEINELKNK